MVRRGEHSSLVFYSPERKELEVVRRVGGVGVGTVLLFSLLQRERRVERMGGSHSYFVLSSPERKESGKDVGQP